MTVRELLLRVKGALGFGGRDRELADEIAFHRDRLEEKHRERGLDAGAARRAARLELGGELQLAEAWRDQRGLPFMRLVAVGVAAGLAAAAASTHLLGALIFGVGPLDPLSFAGAALLLVIVALIAHWVPVRRALRIDPARALRAEESRMS